MGTSNYEKVTNYTVTRAVKSAVKHPKFSSQGGMYFDAGVLTLTQSVQVNKFVQIIWLPVRPINSDDYLSNELVTQAGWGIEQLAKMAKSEKTTTLKFINLKVVI